MPLLYNLLTLFLVINALFWGLWPHGAHCRLASFFGIQECPSHWLHIGFGVVCFLVAVVVAQRHMFF